MRHRPLCAHLLQASPVPSFAVSHWPAVVGLAMACTALAGSAFAIPVPGYVAPVTESQAPDYVDDTRGVFIPTHPQQRLKTEGELAKWQATSQLSKPYYNQPGEGQLNTVANGVPDTGAELDRIARDPGLLSGGRASTDAGLYAADAGAAASFPAYEAVEQIAQATPSRRSGSQDLSSFPSLATGGQARVPANGADIGSAAPSSPDGGMEIAVSSHTVSTQVVDMQNGMVRLKEERITVRRALQRMMDQIGAGSWSTVWDLNEANAGLPDMAISMYAEEPFMNVLNALLGRLQSRSGQPLRVIRYDKTQRLVITDRATNEARSGTGVGGGAPGPGASDLAITETVLKESIVSLHYDEIPLVDALENIVNQAGKGQWRLRMYAGTDQVLKPAHIEEPMGTALERILKIFNLRYEVFPGGKLIVITGGDRFGFRGVE